MDKSKRKERIGIVISDKMKKTIVVRVSRMARHSVYNRVIRRLSKFKVHDENNTAKIGDLVRIQETRPLSKDKRWRMIQVIKKTSAEGKIDIDMKVAGE